MKKKLTALALVIVMVAMLFTGLTMAYFTDTDEAVNVFTVGNIDIELKEEVGVTNEDGSKEYPDKVISSDDGAVYDNILPGNVLKKEATVTNTGNNPAYVRVTVIMNNYDLIDAIGTYYENQRKTEAEIQTIIDEVFNGWHMNFNHYPNEATKKDMRMAIPEADLANIDDDLLKVDSSFTTIQGSFHFSVDNWFKTDHEKEQSGYTAGYGLGYAGGYYAQILNDYELCYTYYLDMEPGDDATLFQGLKCPTYFDQELAAMFENLQIEIYADAIQKEGFADAKAGFEALEAAHPLSGIRGRVTNPPVVGVDTADNLIDALAAGEAVALTGDIDENTTIGEGVEGTIDLNEKAINGTLINNGAVTIENGTISGDYFQNNGTAIVSDVTIEAGTPANYASITRGADAETTYNDVDITSGGGGVAAADGAKVTYNSGTLAVNSTSTSGRYLFYTEGAGSEITINGGDFSFSKTLNQKRAYIYAGAGTTVYVNGGNFGKASTRSGYTDGIMGSGTVVIKGGTFGFNPTNWVADGYVATETSGVWTVTAQ